MNNKFKVIISDSYYECADGCCTSWDTHITVKDKKNNTIVEDTTGILCHEDAIMFLNIANIKLIETSNPELIQTYSFEKKCFYIYDSLNPDPYLDTEEVKNICHDFPELFELDSSSSVEEDMEFYNTLYSDLD